MENKININSERQFELDCAKAIAIFCMITVHVYEVMSYIGKNGFLDDLPNILMLNTIEFIGGPMAAPIFMFAMGIGMIYTKHSKPEDFLKRGITLLLMGYALNFFRDTISLIFIKKMDIQIYCFHTILQSFLFGDILQFAGITFIFVALLKKLNFSPKKIFMLSLILQAIGIWATKISISCEPISMLVGLIFPTHIFCCFPLTLWFTYPSIGMVFGEVLINVKNKQQFYKKAMIISIIFLIALTADYFYIGYDIRSFYALANNSCYLQTMASLLWTVPIILIALSTYFFIFKNVESTKLGQLIKYCSKNLNTIYII